MNRSSRGSHQAGFNTRTVIARVNLTTLAPLLQLRRSTLSSTSIATTTTTTITVSNTIAVANNTILILLCVMTLQGVCDHVSPQLPVLNNFRYFTIHLRPYSVLHWHKFVK